MRIPCFTALLYFIFLFTLPSCSTEPGKQEEPDADSARVYDPYGLIPFDTAKMVSLIAGELHKMKSSDTLLKLRIHREGHEYISDETWMFNSRCQLTWLTGQWASETTGGTFFFRFDGDSMICGEEINDQELSYSEILRYWKSMQPYCGYRLFRETQPNPAVPGQGLTEYKEFGTPELKSKEKQLYDLLRRNKSSINASFKDMQKKAGHYYLIVTRKERITEDHLSDAKEEYYIDSLLYHCKVGY